MRGPFADVAPGLAIAAGWAVGGLGLAAVDGLPGGRWSAVHYLTLGVLTTVLTTFMRHFAGTLLRRPLAGSGVRWLLVQNLGAALVVGGRVQGWTVAVALGASLLTVAVLRLWWLLRSAPPRASHCPVCGAGRGARGFGAGGTWLTSEFGTQGDLTQLAALSLLEEGGQGTAVGGATSLTSKGADDEGAMTAWSVNVELYHYRGRPGSARSSLRTNRARAAIRPPPLLNHLRSTQTSWLTHQRSNCVTT